LVKYCGMRFYNKVESQVDAPAEDWTLYDSGILHAAEIGWTSEDSSSVRWLCSGSLIWENFILTAARCAANDDKIPPDVARVGVYYSDEFAQQLKIVDIIRHPKHRLRSTYYDIALVKLERNVTVDGTVAPTCLWLDDEIRFPELFTAGWGRAGFEEDKAKILSKASLVPISNEKCSTYYPEGSPFVRKGLMDHQLCASKKNKDICPGDIGGPLYVQLFNGRELSSFLVGVTSFELGCDSSDPSIYVKVSKFGDWIIETLQRHGEMATRFKFEPTVCANRHYIPHDHKRDVMKMLHSNNKHVSESVSSYIVSFARQHVDDPIGNNCSGTLIEPNVVLTTAECVLDEGQVFYFHRFFSILMVKISFVINYRTKPTHVVLANGKMIEMSEIIVHPSCNSSISPFYNNIAVVKLTSFAPILPFCGWYGGPKPDQKLLITGQRFVPNEDTEEYNRIEIMTHVSERSPVQCRLASRYSDLLPQGLRSEHLCYENHPFLVPGTCDNILGSPIERINEHKGYIDGINLLGRDCGYGEPAVGIRLSAHKAWLESLLLPRRDNATLVHIDTDQELSDECEYADGTKGTCTAEPSCPDINARLQNNQQVIFCGNRNVVCCPNKATDPRMMAIENEFNQCEKRYRHFRTDQQNGSSHAIEIGWQDDRNTTYGCYGYLISTRGVVSSASCLSERADLPNIVRIGGIDSLDNSRVVPIEKVIIHPDYNKETLEHNIAIVKLESTVDPSENVFPTCLWQNITHSPVKQLALLNRTFDEHYTLCMNPGITTSNNHLVKDNSISKSCYDSGSPIIWRQVRNSTDNAEYLVHMYSHGSCDLNTPHVVTRVAAYIEWFKQLLQ
uniref:Peptidase S1 domain-containing protein n=1 Tax=Anopheles coluzzii TaxID=1518534 RepID=A0A8W7P710_ANOCL